MSEAQPNKTAMHQKSTQSPQGNLSNEDEKVWNSYIKQVFSKPEHKFKPAKGPDQSLPYSLDLHGMTVQQAFNNVRLFLEEHRICGSRTAIVITGKGGKITDELPLWIENLGFIRKCDPILDSDGEHGAYLLTLYARR